METNHDLCGWCSYCYNTIKSILGWTWGGEKKLETMGLPEDLKEGCNFCSFLYQLHLENCDCGDPASHKQIELRYYGIQDYNFVQPPVKQPIRITFYGVGRHCPWYFVEEIEKDHLKGAIGHVREVKPKLGETDWSMIQQWIDGCMQRHESDCNSPLQISELEVLPEMVVIDCKTRKLALWDRKAEFAALSYVWGSETEQNPTGDSPNPQQSRHILPDPFPEKAIEDALACTSKLNIPYLWVDRYCINQKPTTDKEYNTKQHLIQSMDKIYSAATVTIINMSGDDAYAGLPGVSNTLRILPWSSAVIGRHKIIPVVNAIDDFETNKWARRGWTLQEGLLARRRLIFTDTRVCFQCTQSYCIENIFGEFDLYRKNYGHTSPPGYRKDFPISVIGSRSSNYSIKEICVDFTDRDLKTDTDALNACLGIFSRLWKGEEPVYQYCGLPFLGNSDTSFALSLLWGFYTDEERPPDHYLTIPFRRDWVPSWSWLSTRILLRFTHSRVSENDDAVDVCVDIRVPKDNKPQDIMSTIGDYVEDIDNHDGLYQNWLPYLRLSGWITTVFFGYPKDYPDNEFDGNVCCYLESGRQNGIGDGLILPPMWLKLLKDDEAFNSSRSLEVMIIADDGRRKHCLVINRIGEVEAGTYERMGTCDFRYYDSPPMEHVQGMSYLTVGQEWPSGEERKLECRWETITLK